MVPLVHIHIVGTAVPGTRYVFSHLVVYRRSHEVVYNLSPDVDYTRRNARPATGCDLAVRLFLREVLFLIRQMLVEPGRFRVTYFCEYLKL